MCLDYKTRVSITTYVSTTEHVCLNCKSRVSTTYISTTEHMCLDYRTRVSRLQNKCVYNNICFYHRTCVSRLQNTCRLQQHVFTCTSERVCGQQNTCVLTEHVCLDLSLCFSLSVSVCIFLCLSFACLSFFLSLCVSFCASICVCVSLCFCGFFLRLSVSRCVSCLCFSVCLSILVSSRSVFTLSACFSLSLSLCAPLYLGFDWLSASFYPSFYLFLIVSFYLFHSHSEFIQYHLRSVIHYLAIWDYYHHKNCRFVTIAGKNVKNHNTGYKTDRNKGDNSLKCFYRGCIFIQRKLINTLVFAL